MEILSSRICLKGRIWLHRWPWLSFKSGWARSKVSYSMSMRRWRQIYKLRTKRKRLRVLSSSLMTGLSRLEMSWTVSLRMSLRNLSSKIATSLRKTWSVSSRVALTGSRMSLAISTSKFWRWRIRHKTNWKKWKAQLKMTFLRLASLINLMSTSTILKKSWLISTLTSLRTSHQTQRKISSSKTKKVKSRSTFWRR